MTSGDGANQGLARPGGECELIEPAPEVEKEGVFFDREGDKHELGRCEVGGHVAEVREALGGGEEIVQGILVFLSECAAEADQALEVRAGLGPGERTETWGHEVLEGVVFTCGWSHEWRVAGDGGRVNPLRG